MAESDIFQETEDFPDRDQGGGGDLLDDALVAAAITDKEESRYIRRAPGGNSTSCCGGGRDSPGPALSSAASSSSSSLAQHPRRYQVYVGNLTWWTTDRDVEEAVQSLGINDFVEVKFYENRANGQSKGFCCLSLGSEASMKEVLEKLPKREFYQQSPVVTYATKQALHQFEAASKSRPVQQQQGRGCNSGGSGSSLGSGAARLVNGGPNGGSSRGPGGGGATLLPGLRSPLLPSSTFSRPPPGLRPPPPVGLPPVLPPTMPPPIGSPLISGPPPGITRHPSGLPPSMVTVPPPPPHSLVPPARAHPLPQVQHVNAAFLPRGPPPVFPSPSSTGAADHELEEILERNRSLSSSAIAHAVQDAANSDYASAIKTLVSAISLIKQSKVAGDERCKILIVSLKDTLQGIENKGGFSAEKRKSSSRSQSREREGYTKIVRSEKEPCDGSQGMLREPNIRYEDAYHTERSKSRETEVRRSRIDDCYNLEQQNECNNVDISCSRAQADFSGSSNPSNNGGDRREPGRERGDGSGRSGERDRDKSRL